MWKDSIRNIVVIFQTNILRIVGFYVRYSANAFERNEIRVTGFLKWTDFSLQSEIRLFLEASLLSVNKYFDNKTKVFAI